MLDSANDLYNSLLTSNFAITSIAIELSNQYNKQLSSQKNKVPTKFELITQWIRIHSHENLTVQTIAEEFQLTPTYLSQLFKKYKGISTIQYINQKKIAQAAELLITTDKTIKEISMELGFSSEKYFMKVFKLTNKLTPTEFRNSFPKTYLNNHSVDPSFPKPKQMMT
ncbi:helix-turn-helix domain-containing protein [Melissococcus plutonius]|uniref:helix-turn-helix domain-containing protein n=1 Tax=Melissococcus plutonius TaxID=33970 RepID=UPI003C2E02FF